MAVLVVNLIQVSSVHSTHLWLGSPSPVRISQSFSAFSVGDYQVAYTSTQGDAEGLGNISTVLIHRLTTEARIPYWWQWRFNFDSITCTRNVYVIPYHHGVFHRRYSASRSGAYSLWMRSSKDLLYMRDLVVVSWTKSVQ